MASRRTNKPQPTRRDDASSHRGLPLWFLAAFLVLSLATIGIYMLMHQTQPVAPHEEKIEEPEPVYRQPTDPRTERYLQDLTLEQRVAQLFVIQPEALTDVEVAVAAGETTRTAISKHPVGGLIYFSSNLVDPKQTREMLRNTQNYAKDTCGLPMFLCVDEEGGAVARVADNAAFDVEDVGDMADIGATEDPERARAVGYQIGTYLSDLGFTVAFAPVADVATSESSAMVLRSFGSDANLVAEMVSAEIEGLMRAGVLCAAKHFPGIGDTQDDSHLQGIYSSRTADELAERELIPFQAAIREGVPMIMVSHLTCTGLGSGEDADDGDEEGETNQPPKTTLPASLDPEVIQGLLRGRLGYDGLVITDSLQMDAAQTVTTPDEQGVLAIEAGADLILMPTDFERAYLGVLSAVQNGRISEDRINESVCRIIDAKLSMG